MTIDQVLSWLFFGLAGVVIGLVVARLRPQLRARRRLETQPGYEGPAIIARTRTREKLVYLWISGVIMVFGGLQIVPHERHDLVGWVGTLAAMSIPTRMILAILAGDRDSEEAVRTHPDLGE